GAVRRWRRGRTADRSGPRGRSGSLGRAGEAPASTATGGGVAWERSCWNWSLATHDGIDQSARRVLLRDDINPQPEIAGGLRRDRPDAGDLDPVGRRLRHGTDEVAYRR